MTEILDFVYVANIIRTAAILDIKANLDSSLGVVCFELLIQFIQIIRTSNTILILFTVFTLISMMRK